ncbi:MAG: AAA family ATPase [Candidatus Aureabacteria bacterium]|nr:AAA family ATPase [Candidatus Auribacterota bacterium]
MKENLKKNILITGDPGAGKTTLVREVLGELGVKPGGYLTRAMPERGVKTWCEIISLTAGVVPERAIFASMDRKSPPHLCGMGVSATELEAVGAVALERAMEISPLIVMDEIGHMEIVSRRFQNAVLACLDSLTPVLGVIKIEHGPFVDRIKARPDIVLIKLSNVNYDVTKHYVKAVISSLLRL